MAPHFTVGNKQIGPGNPAFIIAEAGVNHNGDIELAKKLVLEAKWAGADCVKFQTFKADRLVTPKAPKAQYQLKSTDPAESQLDMLRKLELPLEDYEELMALCRTENILFLSTPYNIEDVTFLDELGVSAFKIASGQAVEPLFLKYVAERGKPLFLSTGMCTLAEVDEAVRVIQEAGNEQFVVLQCTTNYPSAAEDCNLRAMVTMGLAFGTPVGYSDHTQSLTAATLSVALGACVIERHFTLDKSLHGPDHSSSSDPEEFKQLVEQIREAEACLGSGLKRPADVEVKNAVGMRRSIIAKTDISKDTVLTTENLTFKRPGVGINPSLLTHVLGKRVREDVEQDELIRFEILY